LVSTDTQIAHSTKKLKKAQNTREEVVLSEKNQQEKLGKLQKELVTAKQSADAAQGNSKRTALSL
jgi:structural maintenance of chromosome 1